MGERLNQLNITNGFFEHTNINTYIWTQETRKLSMIDYVIIINKTTITIKEVRG